MGRVAEGVSVCDGMLWEVDEDAHPMDVAFIDGDKECVVE